VNKYLCKLACIELVVEAFSPKSALAQAAEYFKIPMAQAHYIGVRLLK